MKIKHKILARLGIWWTGHYDEYGELFDWEMKQTLIRKFLNRVWDFLIRHGIADDEKPCPHWDLPTYMYQTTFYK